MCLYVWYLCVVECFECLCVSVYLLVHVCVGMCKYKQNFAYQEQQCPFLCDSNGKLSTRLPLLNVKKETRNCRRTPVLRAYIPHYIVTYYSRVLRRAVIFHIKLLFKMGKRDRHIVCLLL